MEPASLTWVYSDIVESLDQARYALEDFAEGSGALESMSECATALHGVRGVLEMLEFHGLSFLMDEMETLSYALVREEIARRDEACELLMRGIALLPDYLEYVRSGHRDNAILLMPLLNDLRSVRGEPLLSESVLFSPELWSAVLPAPEPGAGDAELWRQARKLRPFFQKGLLGWFRGAPEGEGVGLVSAVVFRVGQQIGAREARRLWWVAAGLVHAIRRGDVESSVALKRVVGQLDRELKRLGEEGAAYAERRPPAELLKNLLYYVAQARPENPQIRQVRDAFGLDELLVGDAAQEFSSQVVAGPSAEGLRSVAQALKEDIAGVKDSLDTFVRNEDQPVEELVPQTDALNRVADTLGLLSLGEPRRAVLDQAAAIRRFRDADAPPSQDELMAIARVLLSVDTALDGLAERGLERTAAEAGAAAGPVTEDAAGLTGSEYRQLLTAVIAECKVNLAAVKDALATFVREPGEHERLQEIPERLHQVEGSLAVLSLERARELLAGWRGYVQRTFVEQRAVPDPERLDVLAETVVGIEYYLEAIAEARGDAEAILGRAEGGVRALESAASQTALGAAATPSQVPPEPEGPIEISLAEIPAALLEDLLRAKDLLARIDGADSGPDAEHGTDRNAGRVAAETGSGTDDAEILEVFLEEAEQVRAALSQDVPRWLADPSQSGPLMSVRRAFHTLKGSGRLVGADAIADFAWAIERLLNQVIERVVPAAPSILALTHQAYETLPALIEALRAGGAGTPDLGWLIERAEQLSRPRAHAPHGAPAEDRLADRPGEPDCDGQRAAVTAEIPSAAILSFPERREGPPAPRGAGLAAVFVVEARAHLAALAALLAGARSDAVLALAPTRGELMRRLHTLRGSAQAAELGDIAALCGALEDCIGASPPPPDEGEAPPGSAALSLLRDCLTRVEEALGELQRGGSGGLPARDMLLTRIAVLGAVRDPTDPTDPADSTDLTGLVGPTEPEPDPAGIELDRLKERLLEAMREPHAAEGAWSSPGWGPTLLSEAERRGLQAVFLDEASDLLELTDAALGRWRRAPENLGVVGEIQREVHTLKGGARIAGLSSVSDLAHALESLLILAGDRALRLGPPLFDLLQHVQDRLAGLLDQVRAGQPLSDIEPLIEQIDEFVSPGVASVGATRPSLPAAEPLPGPGPSPATEAEPRERIPVDAGLLDELVSHAGEASIGQSRIERHVAQFRQNADEMDRTVKRLRDQLRRLEMETESQILFRHRDGSPGGDSAFDPLELDRFSTMQELSRALAESLDDLSSIQGALDELTRDSEGQLAQQARTHTELQHGLLRTRMLPFTRQVSRLRRLVRETARELGKQVTLEVRGEETQLDRNILNRMQAPLEHLLRNAVDHGIEEASARARAGKPPAGRIELALFRDGHEVVLEVTDDGRGLDAGAIRTQAVARGLLAADAEPADEALWQLALEPSVSTAGAVTQISGRGVGLDVVKTEIKQLGGSVEVVSRAGLGAIFRVRLPFTLAVSQALLLIASEETFALPLSSVDAIVRRTAEELGWAGEGAGTEPRAEVEHGGHRYRLARLAEVLGLPPRERAPRRSDRRPVVLLGAGERKIALLVDELGGRREIVVKPVGRQLGTIPWLTGATILADGKVVLVLEPESVTRLAVSGPAGTLPAKQVPSSRPPSVMVVDDSITVRKVTGRFLTRSGMRVRTAKDGLEALSLLEEEPPDVLLLDIEMPRMDGFELATTLRNDPRFAELPVIMITSRSGEKHADRAAQIGVDRYLGKPYDDAELVGAINALVGAG